MKRSILRAVLAALISLAPCAASAAGLASSSPGAVLSIPTSSEAIFDFSAFNNSIILPIGTTGQRPSTAVAGMIRYNSSAPGFEAYSSGQWASFLTSATDLGISTITASDGTTPRPLAAHFADHYNVADFGAVCNGTTDDTAAFNAASLKASTDMAANASIALIDYKGVCRVCGLTVYRNTAFNNAGGQIKVGDHCAASPPITSEGYATNIGTGKYCSHDSTVPSWFGFINLFLDCNVANNSSGTHYTGECVGLYGPAQVMGGKNQIVNWASDPGLKTEDSNNATNSAQCQEEGYFDTVVMRSGAGRGWLFHGPHDSHLREFVGGFNADYSFYSESGSTYDGTIDWIGSMHTYAEANGHGMYFGATVTGDQVMSDGDVLTIPSGASAHFTQAKIFNCGYNGTSNCLNVIGANTQIEKYQLLYYSGVTNVVGINWSGAHGHIRNGLMLGAGGAGNTGFLNTSTDSIFTGIDAQGFSGAGAVAINEQGNHNEFSGHLTNNATNITYSGSGNDKLKFSIYLNAGQTALSGSQHTTDDFSILTDGVSTAKDTNVPGNLHVYNAVNIGTTGAAAAGTVLDLSNANNASLALALPSGTIGQRPGAPVNGELRYDSSTPDLESYINGAWVGLTTGPISAGRLPNSGASAGSYGTASAIPAVTVDATGRITAISTNNVAISAGAVSGLAAIATSGSASDLSTGTLNASRLPNSGVSAGSYGTASAIPAVTVDATGRITSVSTNNVAISAGAVSGLALSATTDTTNASNITSGTLPAARLPTPTPSALGGLLALASSTANQVVQYVDTSGVQHLIQLAFSNLSGNATIAQGGTGFTTYSEANRVPNGNDDTTKVYSAGNYWKDPSNNLWTNAVNTSGAAAWTPIGNLSAYPCDAAGGCYSAYGIFKLVSTYAGSSFQVIRASDSTTQNIGFVSNPSYVLPVADLATLNTFCEGTTCTIAKFYNQSSSTTTDDCIPSAAGARPPATITMIGGYPTFEMNGNFRQQQASSFGAECTDASYSIASNSVSAFVIGRMNNTGNTGLIMQTGGSGAWKGRWFVSSSAWNVYNSSGNSNFIGGTQGKLSTMMDVFGFTSGASTNAYYFNDNSLTGQSSLGTSQTWTSFTMGSDPSAESNHWFADMNWIGIMNFSSQLSSAQTTQLKQAAYSAFPITPQLREQIVVHGDSLAAGWGDTVGQPWPYQLASMLPKPYKVTTTAVGGITCTSISTASPNQHKIAVQQGYNNMILIECGSNDIFTGRTPSQAYTDLQTVISNDRTVDSTDPIFVLTMIDRANGSQETNRQTYNTSIRNGITVATIGTGPIYLVDIGGSSSPLGVSGNSTNTTYFQSDQIHLTEAGYNVIANYAYSAIMNNNLLK